jgi:diadenosine tetraphosphatase ApaH/serine/threonine PP2A family protein phosphatase
MKFLIFSDVHSNLEALRAFEELAEGIEHDKKVCLGDLVGYCADPNPCLNWIREHVNIVLAGNHDYAALGKTDLSYFNPYALESCHWTRKALTKKSVRFLSGLPADLVANGVHWTHASPHEPEEWHYILSRIDGKDNFPEMQAPVCFFGHTHQPLVLEEDSGGGIAEFIPKGKVPLKKNCRTLINVGSLGQPRDGDPRPVFVLYDQEAGVVEFHRFEYDIALTQKKIRKKGLPRYLADRLSQGM